MQRFFSGTFFLLLGFSIAGTQSAIGAFSESGQLCKQIKFDLIDNRIFVNAYVNDRGPFQFMVDTGSSESSVDLPVAEALALKLSDPFPIHGAGPGQGMGYHTEVSSLRVENTLIQEANLIVVPTENVRKAIGFAHFDGVIGAQLFLQFVVGVDFVDRFLDICSPAYDYAGPGKVVPLKIQENSYLPFLAASLDGIPGQFIIDTGDRSTLTIFADFSNLHHVEQPYTKIVNMITGEGVGGPIPADVLRLRSFAFGGEDFSEFPARLPAKATFSVDGFAGSIGTGLLKADNLIFDYPRKRFIFLERSGIGYQEYDRSGLWLVSGQGIFQVMDVVAGSAADMAGVEKNDEIISVNGIGAPSLSLPAVRNLLERNGARRVLLTIKRKNTLKNYSLALSDLI